MCVIDNDECSKPGGRMRRGMCQVHYRRLERHGDPHKRVRKRRESHGKTGAAIYQSWLSMIQRCTNTGLETWVNYGGRGITVCERWRSSFEAFLTDMGERPEGTTLDRIDVNGNYEPGNCRWSTKSVQQYNRRKASGTSSQFIGVGRARGTRWRAYIQHNNSSVHVGQFGTEEEAAQARDAKVIELGIDAPLNFPSFGAAHEGPRELTRIYQ